MTLADHHARVELDGHTLSLDDVITVARSQREVEKLRPDTPTYQSIEASARWVQQVVDENAQRAADSEEPHAVYGINTGFGIHAIGNPLTDAERTRQASRKLIESHSTGVGDSLPIDVVRAGILIRVNALARGRSGVRPLVINRLVDMLNRRITPDVPSMGSLGASGDLAPLSHLALVMSKRPDSLSDQDATPGFPRTTGMAWLHQNGEMQRVPADVAMTWDGTDQRIVLEAKEGLALNNGATFSTALGVLALHDADNLVCHAEIATALTLEALRGYRDAFLPPLHAARPHPGQIASAANVLALVQGSRLPDPGDATHNPVRQPPQDPYSVRCAPQVTGAIRESLAHTREVLEREINAATDNPLIFVDLPDDLPRDYKAISGGNFHGEIIGFAMDALKLAITELASISERRTFWMMNPSMARGLPSMLVSGDDSYIDSGLMITQYVAASLVSRCKTLVHPDSADSIPSSANQEDHVAMSMNAALHARDIVKHATSVLAIELLAGITAIRHRLAMHKYTIDDLGEGTRSVWQTLAEVAPEIFDLPLDRDVIIYPYIERMTEVILSHALIDGLRDAGFHFKNVRSQTTLIED